jgi:hypothetical protein
VLHRVERRLRQGQVCLVDDKTHAPARFCDVATKAGCGGGEVCLADAHGAHK